MHTNSETVKWNSPPRAEGREPFSGKAPFVDDVFPSIPHEWIK